MNTMGCYIQTNRQLAKIRLLRIQDWCKCPQEIKETEEQEQIESVVVENGEGGRLTVSYFILLPGYPTVCMN